MPSRSSPRATAPVDGPGLERADASAAKEQVVEQAHAKEQVVEQAHDDAKVQVMELEACNMEARDCSNKRTTTQSLTAAVPHPAYFCFQRSWSCWQVPLAPLGMHWIREGWNLQDKLAAALAMLVLARP